MASYTVAIRYQLTQLKGLITIIMVERRISLETVRRLGVIRKEFDKIVTVTAKKAGEKIGLVPPESQNRFDTLQAKFEMVALLVANAIGLTPPPPPSSPPPGFNSPMYYRGRGAFHPISDSSPISPASLNTLILALQQVEQQEKVEADENKADLSLIPKFCH